MFRKLKSSNLAQSKFKNYLLYALGEIILVVAGILIALQVNNHNLKSLQKEQEIKILTEINSAFKSDTNNLNFFCKRVEYNTQVLGFLINTLNSDKPYHDSLAPFFAKVVTPFMWSESNGAYKTLLSKGLDIISNDEIRKDVLDIHTNLYETIKYLDDGIYVKYPYVNQFCLAHFDVVGSENVDPKGNYAMAFMKPNNYEALKNNKEYMAILKTLKQQQLIFLSVLKSTQKELRKCIEKINIELSSDDSNPPKN